MRDVIECLIAWLDSVPSDDKPHRILRALAQESLKKADFAEEKRRFTADVVTAAAKENPENPNKWLNWRNSVMPYWDTRQTQVIEFARKRGLESYPKPDRLSTKGGRGNETTFRIIEEPLPRKGEDEEIVQTPPDEAIDPTRICYEITSPGEVKPAWVVRWLFRNGQIRLSRWHIWVIIGWLLVLLVSAAALSYLSLIGLSLPRPVTTRELTTFLYMFAIPYLVWIFAIRPWVRLFDDRIVQASDFLVAINEKQAQLEIFRDGNMRLIRLVRYSAPCPVCGATIEIADGAPDFPRRLVGRCSESPREHVFSFDWVTRRGTVLRAPPPI